FIPWTVVGLVAYWQKAKAIIKAKFNYEPTQEFLTLGGITLIFMIISFAQFKLPHYLNIVMPLFAVLSAGYLQHVYVVENQRMKKILLGFQYFILAIVFLAVSFICFYVFKNDTYYNYVWKFVLALFIVYYSLKREDYYFRIITIGVVGSVLLNGVLNTHFYPSLLEYQAGSTMAKTIRENDIPTDKIYKISESHTWALDFYNQKPVKITSLSELVDSKDVWVYVNEKELKTLRDAGLDWDRQLTEKQFRITRLQGKFLDPTTRKKVVNKMHLVHIY
ncbi:MAG: glycosyltransferase family 39 protein, partial [Maribacter sp.]